MSAHARSVVAKKVTRLPRLQGRADDANHACSNPTRATSSAPQPPASPASATPASAKGAPSISSAPGAARPSQRSATAAGTWSLASTATAQLPGPSASIGADAPTTVTCAPVTGRPQASTASTRSRVGCLHTSGAGGAASIIGAAAASGGDAARVPPSSHPATTPSSPQSAQPAPLARCLTRHPPSPP